jgi:tetratricopeptide (TPR) repeat protein
MSDVISDSQESPAQAFLVYGQRAFEAGQYRAAIEQFEQGKALAAAGTALQGELRTWLVMSYEAAGDRDRALELCRLILNHPDIETRKQAKRLLYILEAPKLRMNPEWLTEIPDLTEIPSNSKDQKDWGRPVVNLSPPNPPKPKPPEGYVLPEPTDPSKVNMGDERSFLWALGGAIAVLLGLLLWAV